MQIMNTDMAYFQSSIPGYRIHTETYKILLLVTPEISESVGDSTSLYGNYTTLSYTLQSFLGLP